MHFKDKAWPLLAQHFTCSAIQLHNTARKALFVVQWFLERTPQPYCYTDSTHISSGQVIRTLLCSSASSLWGMKGVKTYGAGTTTNCKARSTWITHYHCQSASQVLLFIYFFTDIPVIVPERRIHIKERWRGLKWCLLLIKLTTSQDTLSERSCRMQKPFQLCRNRHQHD